MKTKITMLAVLMVVAVCFAPPLPMPPEAMKNVWTHIRETEIAEAKANAPVPLTHDDLVMLNTVSVSDSANIGRVSQVLTNYNYHVYLVKVVKNQSDTVGTYAFMSDNAWEVKPGVSVMLIKVYVPHVTPSDITSPSSYVTLAVPMKLEHGGI